MNIIKQHPIPQVVITNNAFAHSLHNLPNVRLNFEKSEKSFWKNLSLSHDDYSRNSKDLGRKLDNLVGNNSIENGVGNNKVLNSVVLPKYLYYMGAKSLSGRRNSGWSTQLFKRVSNILKNGYEGLNIGFREINEFSFTDGRVENYMKGSGNDICVYVIKSICNNIYLYMYIYTYI